MSRAVMISIRPKWCEKIASGEKTIEVRKTRPKMATPFKCYIYCTMPKYPHEDFIATDYPKPQFYGGGKVVGEFTCDRIYELETRSPGGSYYVKGEGQPTTNDVARQSCLSLGDMHAYLKSKSGYGLHISGLKIYDQPKELNEFWFPPELYCEKERCGGCPFDQVADVNGEYSFDCEWKRPLARAPQSWCYVAEEA